MTGMAESRARDLEVGSALGLGKKLFFFDRRIIYR
jgi:hypothetical protein